MPIYWGTATVGEIFNPAAMIVCGDDLDACAAEVARVDASPEAHAALVRAPPLAPGGLDRLRAEALGAELAGPVQKALVRRALAGG